MSNPIYPSPVQPNPGAGGTPSTPQTSYDAEIAATRARLEAILKAQGAASQQQLGPVQLPPGVTPTFPSPGGGQLPGQAGTPGPVQGGLHIPRTPTNWQLNPQIARQLLQVISARLTPPAEWEAQQKLQAEQENERRRLAMRVWETQQREYGANQRLGRYERDADLRATTERLGQLETARRGELTRQDELKRQLEREQATKGEAERKEKISEQAKESRLTPTFGPRGEPLGFKNAAGTKFYDTAGKEVSPAQYMKNAEKARAKAQAGEESVRAFATLNATQAKARQIDISNNVIQHAMTNAPINAGLTGGKPSDLALLSDVQTALTGKQPTGGMGGVSAMRLAEQLGNVGLESRLQAKIRQELTGTGALSDNTRRSLVEFVKQRGQQQIQTNADTKNLLLGKPVAQAPQATPARGKEDNFGFIPRQ